MSGIEVQLQHRLGEFDLNVEFTAPGSGVTALFGSSGSGKTSVLRAVAGLVRSAHGRISINGELWQDAHRFVPPHHRALGYVFQEASLFPHLSVQRNLEYGWRRVPPTQRRIGFANVVELLGIGALLERAPARLSGGERQRVAIARALLTTPRLLLMDEPLAALDKGAKNAILPYLRALHDEFGLPSLYVSHDPNEVARLADHMILLEQGRVAAQGSARELLTRIDLAPASYDDATSILEGHVSAHDLTYHLTWISMHGGRLAVAREDLPVGRRARVEIQARDVSLSRRAHCDTSIINILPAQVVATRDINRVQTIVRLELEDHQPLLARITRRSAMALGLYPGLHLYAQVKSVALVA